MEMLYGMAYPPSGPERQLSSKDTAIIGFAGAYAGGHNNAQYEQMLKNRFGEKNILAFPSVSTKYAFENPALSRKTYSNEAYYRSLASQAVEQFPDKKTMLIHCHSGGSVEGISFARALLEHDAFQGKTIHLLFTGAPGFAERQAGAIGRTVEFLGKFIDSRLHVARDQQFDLCPPPEEYYAYTRNHTEKSPAHSVQGDIVYADTPASRKDRRETFYTKYMAFLPVEEKVKFAREIGKLDRAITAELKTPDNDTPAHVKELLERRAAIVYDIGGNRYYNEYLANKPEYKNVPAPGLDGTIVGAAYLLRLFSGVAKGLDKEIADLIALGDSRKKNIKVSFGQFEHDTISSIADVPAIRDRMTRAKAIQAVDSWLLMEGLSHESIDNTPQGISAALMKLYESDTASLAV